jgi:predicted nucleic acid-binding Zn ribbon protein
MKEFGDLLKKYISSVQLEKAEEYNNFYESWKSIAGDKIGNNTKIKDVEDGYLIIEIDHTGWKQLIKMNEKSIISRINRQYPALEVKKLKFFHVNKVQIMEENKIIESIKENNLEKIENTEFLDLLKKMKKRSQD